jgi:hypothetical protein
VCRHSLEEKSLAQGARVEKNLADTISSLPTLNKAQLLILWHENLSKAPPPKLRKELMVPILAYRMALLHG